MFLSHLVNKEIYTGKTPRGVCLGVGISLKNQAVKYLLCANAPNARAQFAVPVSAVERVAETIQLSRLRPVLPKNCVCLFPDIPIYAYDGTFLGNVVDLEMTEFVATVLYTDGNEDFPASAIAACADAVLLKKEQPYPLGQRIPAPFLPLFTDKADGVVSKPLLRSAIRKNTLIKLTLSLPPFSLDIT